MQTLKYKVGDKFLCVRNLVMDDGQIAFKKGNKYSINSYKTNTNDQFPYIMEDEQKYDNHGMNDHFMDSFFIPLNRELKLKRILK